MSAVTIGGVPVFQGGTYSNFSAGDHTIASDIVWIPHDSNGKKSFSISPFTGWLYSNYNYSSGGASYDLPDIPRQATITQAPNFTDVENPAIQYSNPAGEAVSALDACISLTSREADIVYRPISKTGSSYTFPLTDAERNLLRNNTANSRDVYFFVRTKIGSAIYHSSLKRTFTVTQSDATKPSVGASAQLNNGALPDKFSGMYIKGKSKLDVTIAASGKFGATIKSLSAVMEGVSYSGAEFTTQAFKTSGTVDIKASAKDSRGFTSQSVISVTVMDYEKPSVVPIGGSTAIMCYRSDGNGNRSGSSTSVWIKAKRSYRKLETGGEQKNLCALQWRYKPVNGSYGDWQNLISKESTSTDEYNAQVTGVFDQKQSYTVQIRAIDDFGETDEKTLDIPTQDVALHLGKGGKNVSIGTYCNYEEDYTLRSAWKAIFENGVYLGTDKITDIVVEQGTSGIWTYRKYASGASECWITKEQSVAGTSSGQLLGGYWATTGAISLPSGLFTETPRAYGSARLATGLGFIALISGTKDQITMHVIGNQNSTTVTISSVICIGKWK